MPGKLTLKQDLFVLAYIETGNATEAYRQAYDVVKWKPQSVNRCAHAMMANIKIVSSVAERRAAHAKRHNVTLDSLTIELEEARKLAMTAREGAAAAVAAVMGKGKLHGLIQESGRALEDASVVFLNILREMNKARLAAPGDGAKVIEHVQPVNSNVDGKEQAESAPPVKNGS